MTGSFFMKTVELSHGFAWMCGAKPGELFYVWEFVDGSLYWSERSAFLFPGYWGA